MSVTEEERLIKNSYLFISVRENRNVKEKLENVAKYLNEGADVNAIDANDINNTPIHIAVIKGDIEIVKLLIDKGANLFLRNSEGKSPLDIAKQLNNNNADKIVDLFKSADKLSSNTDLTPEIKETDQSAQVAVKNTKKKKQFFYLKRTGTSGVCGQLYETKLLSLVLMRALNDKDIENFHLGTNINGIGDLDDICLRYHVKGQKKPIMVFLQAKHREDREKGRLTVDDVKSVSGDFSLRKYFESYLTIKERFQPKNQDDMFDGEFTSVECNLIIYTPAKDCFTKKLTDKRVSIKVDELINTGQESVVFQYEYDEKDVELLTKLTVEERVKKLGSTFLHFILAESDKLQVMMTAELIARYHVVMGREVLKPMIIQDETKLHRIWQFRPDFFTRVSGTTDVVTNDFHFLVCLWKTFYKELSTTRCDKTSISDEISGKKCVDTFYQMLQNPCAITISKVIGKLVTYDCQSKNLQLIELKDFKKRLTENQLANFKQRLRQIEVIEDVIKEAVRIKLESIQFKLPPAFGNLDMTIRGTKVENRIGTIAEKLLNLFSIYDETKIVEINDEIVGVGKTIEKGIIDINGGIGSAVGNLLILDEETKMMMLETDVRALPKNATLLLDKLRQLLFNKLRQKMKENGEELSKYRIRVDEELSKYRINININEFPKVSFNGDEYDKRQARDFLSKIWFYANQAKEDEVESILKKDISKYYNNEKNKNQFSFRVHSDAIFLRSHDEIQKWWMQSGEAPYLSKSSEIFEQAKQAVIDSPLLTVINFMYNLKMQNIGIKFNQDAVRSLELHNISQRLLNVITEGNIFTAIKLMQHFEKQDHYIFIDFDYVLSLPLNDYNTMLHELQHTNNIETLIIIYEKLKYYEGLCNKLKQVIKLFNGRKIIAVTDYTLAEQIKEHVGEQYQSVVDNNTYLIDLDEQSQKKILKESTIVFQGEEMPFMSILNQKTRGLIRTEMLYKVMERERIEIGNTLLDQRYKDVRDNYIDRSLTREDTYLVHTLNDIEDDIVVVSGRTGIGKSVLLTHLALGTKLLGPLPWLVRINLLDHEKQFSRWQEENIAIDATVASFFLCNTALKNIDTSIKIELAHNGTEVTVSNVQETIDPIALFELELFLCFYNSGNVIFLFDEFDAICPHYENEVSEVLKILKNDGKRMWITTRSYNHTKMALKREFGTPYSLDSLDNEGKKSFINRFFRTNLRLERLNYDQLENVRSFLKYMSKFTNRQIVKDPDRSLVPIFSVTFHLIYILAVEFFQSEINRVSPSIFNDKLRENFQIDLNQYTPVDELLGRSPDDEELELASTPLHLYIATNYLKCRIEDRIYFGINEQEAHNKWDLMVNTFTLYQNFVEAHMKRIFCKEEPDDLSIISTFQKTRREFLDKHKKLGLFTICKEEDISKLLKEDEIAEVKNTISRIQSGEDRSSLVNCVVNDIPRFAHLVFAEYFAMECLTDIMKSISENSHHNPFKSASLWQSIFNILLFKGPPGLRNAFNYKLQSDSTIAKLANSDVCRKVVFELLLKERRMTEVRDEAGPSTSNEAGPSNSPITDAIEDGLLNILNLFLSSAQLNLQQGNIDEVVELVRRSGEKFVEFSEEYGETVKNLIDSVKNLDTAKLVDVMRSGELIEVPLRHANDYCSSETASVLQSHVVATTSQIPVIAQSFQQIFQESENVGQAVTSMLKTGVERVLNEFVAKMQEE